MGRQSPIRPAYGSNSSIEFIKSEFPNIHHVRGSGFSDSISSNGVARIVNLNAEAATNVIGIPHHAVTRRRKEMAEDPSTFSGYTAHNFYDPHREKFAQRVRDMTGWDGNNLMMRAGSGDAAVGQAIMAAWQVTAPNHRILAAGGSYHGYSPFQRAIGRWSTHGDHNTGESHNASCVPADFLKHVHHFPSPAYEGTLAEHIEWALDTSTNSGLEKPRILIIEPVQFAGGTYPREDYYDGLADVVEKHDFIVIADEHATWARFGTWFASHAFDIPTDIYVAAKGFMNANGGLAATIMSPGIRDAIDHRVKQGDYSPDVSQLHSSTNDWKRNDVYLANAVLDVLEYDGLLTKGNNDTRKMYDHMERSLHGVPGVVDVEGGRGGWTNIVFEDTKTAFAVYHRLFKEHGYKTYTAPRKLTLLTPLVNCELDYGHIADAVTESIEYVMRK